MSSRRVGESLTAYRKRHCREVLRWQRGNPTYLAYQAQYRAGHLRKKRAYMRARHHRLKRTRAYREARAQTYRKNYIRIVSGIRKWNREHPEAIRRYSRRSYLKQRNTRHYVLRTRKNCAKRRAWLRKAKCEDFTVDQLEGRWRRFSNRCAYCGKRRKLEQDHVRSLANHGKHRLSNLVPACGSCNRRKQAFYWLSWFRAQPFYSKQRENRIKQALKKGG